MNYVEEKERLEILKAKLWRSSFNKVTPNKGLQRQLRFVYSALDKINKMSGARTYNNSRT